MGFKHQGNNVMTGVISGGKVQGMDFVEAGDSTKVWLQVVFPQSTSKGLKEEMKTNMHGALSKVKEKIQRNLMGESDSAELAPKI